MFRNFIWIPLVLVGSCLGSPVTGDDSLVDYNRDVRPILSDKCYRCHGPDEKERQTELRLDDETSAFSLLESGVMAVMPHEARKSEIFRRITSDDDDLRMPPSDSGIRISSAEIEIIKRWIDSGANWGTHWSFTPPRSPIIPEIHDQAWPENPIDYFVLAKLEELGWQPSRPADKRTVIRRATLATLGVPPSREEVHAFISDTSPHAYEQLIDRLLQSPRYGEHQARYWLDLARYGDTHGLHLDNERSIWRYRDWVIDAFNKNMPFDQFTIEQLAGDLIPNATLEQRIATGFHRCNVTTSEGGAIAEEFLTRYAIDRVETTSAVWMGLTTGCAACHDHKFDPISQREFYQLYAYFYNLTEKAMDGNAQLPPPSVKAPTHLQQIKLQRLRNKAQRIDAKINGFRNELKSDRRWEREFAESFSNEASAPGDAVMHLSMDDVDAFHDGKVVGEPETIPGHLDGALSFDGNCRIEFESVGDLDRNRAFSFGAWVLINNDGASTVLSRMNDDANFRGYDLYIGGGRVFVHLIHQWQDNAIRVNTTLPLRKEKWHHVFATYDGSSKAAGVAIYVDGVAQDLEQTHDTLNASIRTDEPFRVGQRKRTAALQGAIDELMVFDRLLDEDEVQALASGNPLVGILATDPEHRTEEQDRQLIDAHLRTTPDTASVLDKHAGVKKRLARLEQAFPSTLVMEERSENREAFLLLRGEYDNRGERVYPNVPAALPKSNSDSQSRLSLAQWLVDKDHPLTARVTVNRIWQQYFGVGIVKTSEDFGSQGEWPSHPKLLDYLATELINNGWDLKALHRDILLSATFRQSSKMTPQAVAEDPENRLLSRGPRFRLDAEVIRDFAMTTSGLLVGELGGPSVKPYQPLGLWKAVGYTSSNTANFRVDTKDKLYRRGIYTFWKRTSPPPQMQILDAPSREVCTVRRPRTNTSAAALMMLNDVQFVEAARNLACRVLQLGDTDDARFDAVYEICLSRLPNTNERTILRDLLRSNLQALQESPASAAKLLSLGESRSKFPDQQQLAAWTLVCSTVLNLDEAMNQH